jgi:hypothetical protein
MEGSYFPEDKDLAHNIMMSLTNNDLVKLCATNKRMYDICNNYPSFWRDKFVKDYGEHAAQYKRVNRNWKDYYMTVFIDLQRFKKNPMEFFLNIAWKTDVEDSFFIDYSNERKTPLKDAPDWVMNNLYLLNLNNIKVSSPISGKVKKYKNIKPVELLQEQEYTGYYIHGFLIRAYYYYPRYTDLSNIKFR